MKMIVHGLLILLLVSGLILPRELNAAESKPAPRSQTTSRADIRRFSGKVVSIDPISKTLVVKNWRDKATFDIADTKLTRRANLEDITPGDRIIVSYAEEGIHKIARILTVTFAKREGENKTETSKETKPLTEEPRKK